MIRATICVAISFLTLIGAEAGSAQEATRPFEALEASRRAGIQLDRRRGSTDLEALAHFLGRHRPADEQEQPVDAAEQRRHAPGVGEQTPLVDEAVFDIATISS